MNLTDPNQRWLELSEREGGLRIGGGGQLRGRLGEEPEHDGADTDDDGDDVDRVLGAPHPRGGLLPDVGVRVARRELIALHRRSARRRGASFVR